MKYFKIFKSKGFPASGLSDFSYPWREIECPEMTFKAYYDDEKIYFQFKVNCKSPKVFVKNNNKIEVVNSERVEIFFRKNNNMKPYYCLEIDPTGRVLDYKANFYREFDRSWKWPESLNIKTEKDDKSYTVEGELSFSALNKLELLKDNQIEIGLYRGFCTDISNEKGEIRWISWVDSKSKKPDFHIPSSFGLLKL